MQQRLTVIRPCDLASCWFPHRSSLFKKKRRNCLVNGGCSRSRWLSTVNSELPTSGGIQTPTAADKSFLALVSDIWVLICVLLSARDFNRPQ